jgi:putative ABC transport system substrate-binding protein
MKRRDFLTSIAGAAAGALPRGALAQQAAHRPRVGVLVYSNPQADPNTESFRRAMRDLGYIDGQNVAIEYRAAEGRPERLPELAAELVRLNPHVLFSLGGDVAQFSAASTKSIPIVFASSADPVQHGLVYSLARPGGNATGVTFLLDELASKRLELLKEAAPRVSRVAFIHNPEHIDNEWREASRAARTLGLHLQPLEVKRPDDIAAALRAAADARADALYVASSRLTVRGVRNFVEFSTAHRIPLAGGWGAWTQAGGLLSYGPNVEEMVRRATGYVDRILKGAKPAELPVQQPTRFELLINLKTAKALGLDLPEALLLRADKVIE